MADGIILPCNMTRGSGMTGHCIRQVAAPYSGVRIWFLPRDAMQARPMLSCGVCPSVCPSRLWILWKRINE